MVFVGWRYKPFKVATKPGVGHKQRNIHEGHQKQRNPEPMPIRRSQDSKQRKKPNLLADGLAVV